MPSSRSGTGVRAGFALRSERSSVTTRCVARPGFTELVRVRGHRGLQLGTEAVVGFGVVADRWRDGDLVSLVEAHGAEQAQVEEFGEQAAVALGEVVRRFAGAEEHDPTPGALAAEQFNQRGPKTADVGANTNAHQPRSQVFGADNLLQFGLELEQFSSKRPP